MKATLLMLDMQCLRKFRIVAEILRAFVPTPLKPAIPTPASLLLASDDSDEARLPPRPRPLLPLDRVAVDCGCVLFPAPEALYVERC